MQKVLVANRGEIAIRLIRAAQELGYCAVTVYETPDKDARHLRIADEAVWLGDGPRVDYLNIEKVVKAALRVRADAIHPGYGFLAENPEFSKACQDAGLIFVGPSVEVIRSLGDKVEARRMMKKAGLPVVPGTEDLPASEGGLAVALQFAAQNGYPLMLKATAGGGGRGIRRIADESQLREELPRARAEAQAAFHDDRVYLEKLVPNPKHIEVQILADQEGNVVHLGTRDCSIQRRHQKLVEIAPSRIADSDLLDRVCQAALQAAKTAGYTNAGTVEFLVDEDHNFYFMEINTRLQVEHTVTEMITGIDIVRAQYKLAAGKRLAFGQKDVSQRGHAIEVRINAEDPQQDFRPEGGKTVNVYQSPGGYGVRLDGFVYQGYTVPQVYDSLLVKLTVHGFSWNETVDRLGRCLKNFQIVGPKTTIPFYLNLVDHPDFKAGDFDTSFVETHPELFDYRSDTDEITKLARVVAEIHHRGKNPWAS